MTEKGKIRSILLGESKPEFLKRIVVASLGIVIAGGLGGIAPTALAGAPNPDPTHIIGQDGPCNWGDPWCEVYPTGTTQDFTNVQWAIDNVAADGTVYLHAEKAGGGLTAFNFGQNVLMIMKPLTLTGPDVTGTFSTKTGVDNRNWASAARIDRKAAEGIYDDYAIAVGIPSYTAQVTIENLFIDSEAGGILHFGGEAFGINFYPGGNLEISNCKVVSGDLPSWAPDFPWQAFMTDYIGEVSLVIKDSNFQAAAKMYPYGPQQWFRTKNTDAIFLWNADYARADVTNNIAISNSIAGHAQAIGSANCHNPSGVINMTNNWAKAASVGIWNGNTWGNYYTSSLNVVDNTVVIDNPGADNPQYGIYSQWIDSPGSVVIKNNTVESLAPSSGYSELINMIALYQSKNVIVEKNTLSGVANSAIHVEETDNSYIKGNDITMERDSNAGIVIAIGSDNNTIEGNNIKGVMGCPFYTEGSDNVYHGNNITATTLECPNPEYNPFCPPGMEGAEFTEPEMYLVPGVFGNAVNFTGSDYVDCGNPDELNFGTGDWTISAWAQTTSTAQQHIFANGGDGGGGIRYALGREGTNDLAWVVVDDNMNKVRVESTTAIADGLWHHLVGMRKADKIHIYVDGNLEGTAPLPSPYDLSGTFQANALIGAITNFQGGYIEKFFDGLIDEVRIFDGALTSTEIWQLHSVAGALGDEVACYNCDSIDRTGLVHLLPDSSVNNFHGEINVQACPDPVEPEYLPGADFFFGRHATNNTVRGYSGASVVDLPGEVHVPETIPFGDTGQVEYLWGLYPYLRPEYVKQEHYDFTTYQNPVEPGLTWQRRTCDQLAVWFYDPGICVAGGAYFLQYWVPDYTVPVELVDTVSTLSVFGQVVPDPAGPPAVEIPKDNFITGLEPMTGAGGIGQ